MLQNRLSNGLSAVRKQQTAVKQTVDRPKLHSWHSDASSHRNHSYQNHQFSNETNNWLKASPKTVDDTPELELTCQEDMLTDTQLQNYPTQVVSSHISRKKIYFELFRRMIQQLHYPYQLFVDAHQY